MVFDANMTQFLCDAKQKKALVTKEKDEGFKLCVEAVECESEQDERIGC